MLTAQSSCTVEYDAEGAGSAYLMLTNASSGTTVQNVSLNTFDTQTTLNLSSVSSGNYLVILVCDGQIIDSKNLQIQ